MRSFSMLDVLRDAEPLSQVVFVHDYIQLVFQGITFSLYNSVSVNRGKNQWLRSTMGFCDELCRLIGKRIVETSFRAKEFASVTFDDGTEVTISLRSSDAIGPEAFELQDGKGLWVVEQNG